MKAEPRIVASAAQAKLSAALAEKEKRRRHLCPRLLFHDRTARSAAGTGTAALRRTTAGSVRRLGGSREAESKQHHEQNCTKHFHGSSPFWQKVVGDRQTTAGAETTLDAGIFYTRRRRELSKVSRPVCQKSGTRWAMRNAAV